MLKEILSDPPTGFAARNAAPDLLEPIVPDIPRLEPTSPTLKVLLGINTRLSKS